MRGWKISFVSFFNSYSFLCRHVAVLKVHSCGCNAWGRAFVGQRRIKGLKDTCALTSSLCATFSAFCDTSNASQIGASFLSRDHSLIASLFSSYFLFTPSFFLPTFLRFLSVLIFFSPFQDVIHEASFILLWSFLRIAPLQFAWALNVIRVKWDRCILFEELAYAAISHDFTARGLSVGQTRVL